MALQKRRLGKSRVRNRRAQWMRRNGAAPLVSSCPNCGEPRLPHRVCMHCGQYGGEQIVEPSETRE